MSVLSNLRLIRKLSEAIDADQGDEVQDRARFTWFDDSCPCGKPLGECHEHPRARLNQRPPSGDWRTWLYMAGRGAGKTRSGAEWVRQRAERNPTARIALVAPTAADARDVMIEGESGLVAICPPWFKPKYEPSKRRLTWPNGAMATAYSADEPERLRGPQHTDAWIDEIGAWRYPRAWDMLLFGLRLGEDPRVVATSTPRPTTLIKDLIKSDTTTVTRGTTFDNRANLATQFMEMTIAKYEGTRLGRQELHGELLEIVEGAWFPQFDPARHVSVDAEFNPNLPVLVAIDCGVSRHTGAVFLQAKELDEYRQLITVFADYYALDLFSEANAQAIREMANQAARVNDNYVRLDKVRLDPAATAKTGVGPSARSEYERVFGDRILAFWPTHGVVDGLDAIDVLLGSETRRTEILIHPRCTHMISAFQGYQRAEGPGGEYLSYPKDPQHPYEDMMDALRGGVRDLMPEGRKLEPKWHRRHASSVF